MIKQDAIASVYTVSLTIVYRYPVGVHLGYRIGAAWIKWGGLFLRCLLHQAIKLAGAGLVKTCFLF